MTTFSCIIFLKIWTIVSNFKFIPYFNILEHFVRNVRKPKWPSILSCPQMHEYTLKAKRYKSFLCILKSASFLQVLYMTLFWNAIVNPVVYAWMGRDFRRAFRELLGRGAETGGGRGLRRGESISSSRSSIHYTG